MKFTQFAICMMLAAVPSLACKVRRTTSAAKADTTGNSRTGVDDSVDMKIEWLEAQPGNLKDGPLGGNYLEMYLQPLVCLQGKASGKPDCEELSDSGNRELVVIGPFSVKIGSTDVKPKLTDTLRGIRINEAATRLHQRTGYGQRGEFYLGFRLMEQDVTPWRMGDDTIDQAILLLQLVDPQTKVEIKNVASGAKALINFTKVDGETEGVTGTPMVWGKFTDQMRRLLDIRTDGIATTRVRNFYAAEKSFFERGFTKLVSFSPPAENSEIKGLGSRSYVQFIYADQAENKCLRVVKPNGRYFDSAKDLETREFACK